VIAFLVFSGHPGIVLDHDGLLTTGDAALLLGSSRQHVVDLCERGVLPYVRVGSHRRLRRVDVEAMLQPELTRDQLKALWLHQAVAGRLVADPAAAFAKAVANLDRLQEVHPAGMAAGWLARWRATLAAGIEPVLDALTSRSAHAVELRQNSPFAGVLPEPERQAVLAAFSAYWRGRHAT
jgi:excisionase family DNA binding protein